MKYFLFLSMIFAGIILPAYAENTINTLDIESDAFFSPGTRVGSTQVLDSTFELKSQQHAEFPTENLRIVFLGVLEDSRCPTDVTCVWQGRASLSFEISKGARTQITLSTDDNKITIFNKYQVELISTKPYPTSTNVINPENYVAVLKVTENSIQNTEQSVSKILPPLKQFNSGIPVKEIQCKNKFDLIIRANERPACVKPESTLKFIELGSTKIQQTIPSDFNLVYSFGVGGKNIYDSKEGLLLVDRVCEPAIEIKTKLSLQEKERICDLVKENNFFSFDDFVENCDELGQCTMNTPESITTISITGNGITHTVQHRDSYRYNNNISYQKFEEINQTIRNMLEAREDYKNLPPLTCAYQ